ncbi:MAG: UDP-N-acetylmuramoyl-tripeptide--D-alanyl-D-alanine ligase [Wenzhouxiangellaceae bacterium]
MIRFSLEQAVELTGGRLHPPVGGRAAADFHGMTQDTRSLRVGNLYVALVGQRVDGHRFIHDAANRGARAALVSRPIEATIAQIEVDDVIVAMGKLAQAWRASLPVQVVGITGSNGKTSVKTMLATILSQVAPTLATRGNYNNEVGVPLTLAALGKQHRFAVVEMGCGQPGDIAWLASQVDPDVGMVTNAGPAHLERLGSIEGVARAKGEMFAALGEGDVAVINRDDAFYEFWSGLCPEARQLSFGMSAAADVRLATDKRTPRIVTPFGNFDLDCPLPGQHNQLNALAATAAALALEVEPATIAAGLARVESLPGRLSLHSMPGGWQLIDDSYNANPASLYAGLQVLAEHPHPRWLVLGEMAELGEASTKLHREIAHAARDLGVDRLLVIGAQAAAVADAFGPGSEQFERHEDMVRALGESLGKGVTVLVKGSRSAHMERVIEQLLKLEGVTC